MSYTWDVTLLTESRYEDPSEVDWYIENILTEDRIVKESLEKRGLKVNRVDWARKDIDWSKSRCIMFRTTWDYFHRFEEFTSWLESTSKVTSMINPYNQIKWNMDKQYLKELEEKGANIPPTLIIKKGDSRTLRELFNELGWDELVIKPTFSGAARHTYRLSEGDLVSHEDIYKKLISEEDMMAQEFQHHIVTEGEVSFMVFGGKFTHAILKKAKEGDFRVQDDFGGTIEPYSATKNEVRFAEQIAKMCDPLPLYARVDAFKDNNGELSVGEVELIEPELWFRMNANAADVLAEAVVSRISEEQS